MYIAVRAGDERAVTVALATAGAVPGRCFGRWVAGRAWIEVRRHG